MACKVIVNSTIKVAVSSGIVVESSILMDIIVLKGGIVPIILEKYRAKCLKVQLIRTLGQL
jgi:hypothetical protein